MASILVMPNPHEQLELIRIAAMFRHARIGAEAIGNLARAALQALAGDADAPFDLRTDFRIIGIRIGLHARLYPFTVESVGT